MNKNVDQYQVTICRTAFDPQFVQHVLICKRLLATDTMADIAREIDSECSFVRDLGDGRFSLCWYDSQGEIQQCGAGLIAAGSVVSHVFAVENISFVTPHRGELKVSASDNTITIRLPLDAVQEQNLPEQVQTAALNYSGRFYASKYDWLIELENESAVRSFSPKLDALKKWCQESERNRGLIVTAKTADGFVSRFFAPCNHKQEELFNGSAHAVLASYWSKDFSGDMQAVQLPHKGTATISVDKDSVIICASAALSPDHG